MKHYITYILAALYSLLLPAQEAGSGQDFLPAARAGAATRIDTLRAENDSVLFCLRIRPELLTPGASETLTLLPVVADDNHRVCLPPVVLNGHRRTRYDHRERALDYLRKYHHEPYCILACNASGKYPLREITYRYRLPHASWMNHAALRLELSGKECCETYPLGEAVLTEDLNLADQRRIRVVERWRTDTVVIYRDLNETLIGGETAKAHTTATTPVLEGRPQANVYRIWFLLNDTQIDRSFADNARTLAALDSALTVALNSAPTARRTQITAVHLTGCSSPDGLYADNDSIARHRAVAVKRYLKTNYPVAGRLLLPPIYKVENWDGLERQLEHSQYPWRNPALRIIREVPVNQYRETKLIELQGGDPYREMYRALFPLLRYADIELRYEAADLRREEAAPGTEPKEAGR